MCISWPDSRPGHDRVVTCYVSSWATYRTGHGKFSVEDIDPSICTHLIYAFAGLNSTSSTIRSLDPYNDLEENYGKGEIHRKRELEMCLLRWEGSIQQRVKIVSNFGFSFEVEILGKE